MKLINPDTLTQEQQKRLAAAAQKARPSKRVRKEFRALARQLCELKLRRKMLIQRKKGFGRLLPPLRYSTGYSGQRDIDR